MATVFHGVRGAAEAGAAIVSGEVDGKAVDVAVPASALRDADGHPLDQEGCLEVCLPALERQAAGEAQPWDAEPEAETPRRSRSRKADAESEGAEE